MTKLLWKEIITVIVNSTNFNKTNNNLTT